KLPPDAAALGDRFAAAMSADAGLLLIGAQGDDDRGHNAGAAYVFDLISGLQLTRLEDTDASPGDAFGFSVSIHASLAALGAPGANDEAGSVSLFDALTGARLHALTPDDAEPFDRFGHAVALSGDLVAVGAPGDDDRAQNAGALYLFDAATGAQLRKLVATDGQPEDALGMSVAIEGNLVAVGAPFDNDNGAESGSVYLFDATTGQQLFKLTPDDGAFQDLFGASVALDNDLVAVGAHSKDLAGADSGAAYLFDALSGLQLDRYAPVDAEPGDWFGWSVDLEDRFLIAGARNDNVWGLSSGSATVFDIQTGAELYRLLPNDGAEGDFFGASVAIDAGILACGAYLDDDHAIASGSAYLFDTNYCSPADLAFPPAHLDFSDLLVFLVAFENQEPLGDFAEPTGVFDFADVVAFISLFAEGCP
ncbi:MAG: GC-type dockerin domain-anchored protein, partial [Phycisphaerales bacterium JB059]